uniref:HDc domain-containing protein n=1 Tax=Panagrellus redivivus TaxID=6233 RepID=A0A7E4V576_PANRE
MSKRHHCLYFHAVPELKKSCPEVEKNGEYSSTKMLYNPETQPIFHISDPVYETSIEIPLILKPLIDSVPFQRLRGIKQLGVTEFVYPGATHTRFSHSIGTFHVASCFMTQLRHKYPKKVSGTDHLCVCIAALCHDLGHGPFSHMFEHVWEDMHYRHEDMSITLFDYVMKQLKDENAPLMDYLNETDLQFIREAINPPKGDPNDIWSMKGRPEEKAFLYDLVNNTRSGFDVDKMDYILRDSKHVNIGTRFRLCALERIIQNAVILEQNGRSEICFNFSVYHDIKALFEDREMMHQCVYQHQKSLAIEFEYQEALRLAGPHLMIPGTDGRAVALKDSTSDIEAFLKLDNSVVKLISMSFDPNLKAVTERLNRVQTRQLMPCVALIETVNDTQGKTESKLMTYLSKKLPPDFIDKFRTKKCSFHGGLGVGQDPMSMIKFIGRNGRVRYVPTEWHHSTWLYVYLDYETSKNEANYNSVLTVLDDFCEDERMYCGTKLMFRHEILN